MQWPIGIGAKGNEGVANMTTQTDGAIGYVEYAYAKQNKMAYALLTNKAGSTVAPERRERSRRPPPMRDWASADSYYLILTDQARRQELADHRRELHPRVQAAGRSGAGGRRR